MSLKTKSGKNPGQKSLLGLTYHEKVHKTSWSNCFLQKWREVALDHFWLSQEFAEICMENHDLPSTKSQYFYFERPMMPVFFAKTCKTKIKMKSDPLRAFGPKWIWFFSRLRTGGHFCPPPDQNRVKDLNMGQITRIDKITPLMHWHPPNLTLLFIWKNLRFFFVTKSIEKAGNPKGGLIFFSM